MSESNTNPEKKTFTYDALAEMHTDAMNTLMDFTNTYGADSPEAEGARANASAIYARLKAQDEAKPEHRPAALKALVKGSDIAAEQTRGR